jgi:hypothetical protein
MTVESKARFSPVTGSGLAASVSPCRLSTGAVGSEDAMEPLSGCSVDDSAVGLTCCGDLRACEFSAPAAAFDFSKKELSLSFSPVFNAL